MKNYLVFEKEVLATYRRELVSFGEAENKLFGYLKCMIDMEVIEQDRAIEEFRMSVKKLLCISERK